MTRVRLIARIAVVAAVAAGGASPAAAFVIFTDRAAWEAAAAGNAITTDTFSNPIGSAQSITLDSGIEATNSVPPILPNAFNNNSVNGGVYLNAAGGATASSAITWTFPSTNVFAFGADFISVNQDRLILTGNFDGTGDQTIVVNNTIGGPDGFLGVVGLASFGSIVFGNLSVDVDAFSLDNASFAVPEPGTLALMMSAALGTALMTRRRRRQAAHEQERGPAARLA